MKYDLKIIRECCRTLNLNLDKSKKEITIFQNELRECPLVIYLIKILESIEEKIQLDPDAQIFEFSGRHLLYKFKEILIGLIIEKHLEDSGPITEFRHGSYQNNLKVLLNRSPKEDYIKDIFLDFSDARNVIRNYLILIWSDPRVYRLREST